MTLQIQKPLILRALQGERVERTPVWIMRQAGRYLPEYRAVREKCTFLQLCRTPELACEVTLQPIRRFRFDAAILFSDILIPLEAMGAPVEFGDGGPKFTRPVRTRAQVDALRDADPYETMPFVAQSIQLIKKELPAEIPLLGFAGAPFTLFTYLVEGGGSKDFAAVKRMLFQEPALAHGLLERLATAAIGSLRMQIESGCEAVQLFDTWASALAPHDYETFALPYARRVFDELKRFGAPLIYYTNGIGGILEQAATTGATCLSIDWRLDLAEARARVPNLTFQGNLDPHALLGTESAVRAAARRILDANAGLPGHIFNLGHGIFPEAPIAAVEWLVDEVRRYRTDAL
ncbi:MAG: uroporphyrinogen decarboxylase [Planctomycetes bacterium]|nr:uroporphyrinogen decarboxylase [Planctomycetota bacterium]